MTQKATACKGRTYRLYDGPTVQGERHHIERYSPYYPPAIGCIDAPPSSLYVIGNPAALVEGLGVIGARKATPYGLACAKHFAGIAAEKGIPIISGGAYGCDAAAHRAALEASGQTVVFMGGGCDQIYPPTHFSLFQKVVDAGGALVSEHPWSYPALPHTFRMRNRLIAGLSKAVLIVEAGMPSGAFSTADDALEAGKDVLVVPGAITSKTSAGSNHLLYQGATPVVSSESFQEILFSLFGTLVQEGAFDTEHDENDPLLCALQAAPMRLDDIFAKVRVPKKHRTDPHGWLQLRLAELEASGAIARFPDGRYGPARI